MPVASLFYLLIGAGLVGIYVMPMASPFYLLIGDGSIGVYAMPLTSEHIFVTLGLGTWRQGYFASFLRVFRVKNLD